MKVKNQLREYVFEDDRPFASCHASTVISLPDGDVLIAYFAGTKEGSPDVGIWCSKKTNGVWSKPYLVADEEGLAHWNPVLHRKDNGQIILYYKVGHPIPAWYTRVITSDDCGETWSEPVEAVPGDVGGRGPVKNKLIVLQDGTWLAPASLESSTVWDAFVDISRDEGANWEMSRLVPANHPNGTPESFIEGAPTVSGKGLIQPTLWESEKGHVHMLIRSTGGSIYRSDSTDAGKTWSPAYRTYLPNNNSGIDLVKMNNGTLVLVYNPVGMYSGPRTPLLASISTDNGETWDELLTLEREPGEFSYPAIIADGDHLYITYTWNRERIVFWNVGLQSSS